MPCQHLWHCCQTPPRVHAVSAPGSQGMAVEQQTRGLSVLKKFPNLGDELLRGSSIGSVNLSVASQWQSSYLLECWETDSLLVLVWGVVYDPFVFQIFRKRRMHGDDFSWSASLLRTFHPFHTQTERTRKNWMMLISNPMLLLNFIYFIYFICFIYFIYVILNFIKFQIWPRWIQG